RMGARNLWSKPFHGSGVYAGAFGTSGAKPPSVTATSYRSDLPWPGYMKEISSVSTFKPLEAARPSITILAGIVLLAAIVAVARAVQIRISRGVLVSFSLGPAVVALQRRKVPRTVAVLGVTVMAMLVIASAVYAITAQLHTMAAELPAHKDNFKRKIHEIQGE